MNQHIKTDSRPVRGFRSPEKPIVVSPRTPRNFEPDWPYRILPMVRHVATVMCVAGFLALLFFAFSAWCSFRPWCVLGFWS